MYVGYGMQYVLVVNSSKSSVVKIEEAFFYMQYTAYDNFQTLTFFVGFAHSCEQKRFYILL